ncbi:hypothetical protein M569_05564, partial [Genlisea aurea]
MRNIFGLGGSAKESQKEAAAPATTRLPAAPANVFSGPARPIRLVYTDERGRFHMDAEAVALLQLVKEPVGVVSVCGRARQGKSFILNQLLGRSSGFQVASTHRPCTKGLWLWSAPIKRIALDGTEYKLLLLDSEGIDAYDQTGTYSTQIFSLAVLLSSMFIYNQMGGIDEAALDRLSLVTEMTKHIRVRASSGRSTASELGQFSPIFVWLLRDFYLDLVEDNRRITPRDYLELALRPVQGGKDVAVKNEIRESIRALFPDRECFTLVRPLSNEKDLQRLDNISIDKMRPEFKSGLDALTTFVFERARPKQMGATVMTGPILARITQSFLDALNNGAVPIITSSWQSVEEAECQRAFELATEEYMSSFDRSKPPEEAALREAHDDAVLRSIAVFNEIAVGTGSTRNKYEKRVQSFVKKAFEDIRKDSFREASLQCTNAIESMGKELRAACHAPDAKIDSVFRVSLMALLNKQLESSEHYKSEYLKRYEDVTNDKNKIVDELNGRIAALQKKYSPLEEKSLNLSKALDTAKQESVEWKRKHDLVFSKLKDKEDQSSAEVALLRSKSSAAEARLAAAQEKAESAIEEAKEWERKYDVAVREAKNALEKAAAAQERISYQTQSKEAALRSEFSSHIAEKDEEIKEKAAKLEQVEQVLTTLSLELKAAESKIKSYDAETSNLKLEVKELGEKLDSSNAAAVSAESQARILEQEKVYLEQKYKSQFDRFEELQERCKVAEKEAKRAIELADEARAEASIAQKEKSEFQRVSMEKIAQIERAERYAETLNRQKVDLAKEVERYKAAERDASVKNDLLEDRLREKEKEIETLLQSNSSQRKTTVHLLESLLESERTAHAEANNRAEALSVQLQATQGKLDELSQELNTLRYGEKTATFRSPSRLKRMRGGDDEFEIGGQLSGSNAMPNRGGGNKRSKTGSIAEDVSFDEQTNSHQPENAEEDYTRFTVQQLKQVLTAHGVGEVWQKNTPKREIVALYEKYILKK